MLPIYAEFKNNKPNKQSPNIKKEKKSINTSNLVTKWKPFEELSKSKTTPGQPTQKINPL